MALRLPRARISYSFFGMDDLQLAAGLRSRSPDAIPELLDAYGNCLFGYCWCLLRNRENAQAAVRDVLIIAAGQAGRLARDEWLGTWLYCLARRECRRREAVPYSGADEQVADPDHHHADRRLMAWNAVASMDANEVEALELASRHEADVSLVLGLPPAETRALLDRARQNLELAVAAQVLISRSRACPDLAKVMSAWPGIATPLIRDRVLEHAAACPACGPRRPCNVSAARVFSLLPAPGLSSLERLEVLVFAGDPGTWAYREFVVGRAAELAGSVFLTEPEASRPGVAPQRAVSWPGVTPQRAVSWPGVARGPAISGPRVAGGFIGSWEPAGSGSASALEPSATSSPLSIPPARWAPPAHAGRPAGKSPPGWRQRISRLGVAAAVGVAITVATALVGLRPTRLTPAPARAGRPAAASTSRTRSLATPRGRTAGQATDTGPGAGLSWTGDRPAPFAYRPGPAGPPDRPRAGRDVSGRAHGAEL
jgi:DNA-directed RNA polymerase specialized sigma24 family protein